MLQNIPFTYLIKHIPTNKYYYGVMYRKGCHPNDLWTKYFTSSTKVKNLIKQYGKKSFIFEIRKTFKTAEQALNWEHKVLKRLKVIYRNDFLNLSDNKSLNPKFLSDIRIGKKHTKEAKQKVRLARLNKKHSKETIEKIRLAGIGNKNRNGKKHTKEAIEKIRLAAIGNTNKCFKKNKIDLVSKSL